MISMRSSTVKSGAFCGLVRIATITLSNSRARFCLGRGDGAVKVLRQKPMRVAEFEAYLERLRNTPIPLCRLRYFGGDRWGFALYTFSQEKYELSVFPNGEFFGRPEEAFLLAASFYLDPEAPP